MKTWGGIGGGRHESLIDSLEGFIEHVEHAESVGVSESDYLRYLAGSMKIWRRYHERQISLLEQIIDNWGHAGAAGEAGDEQLAERLEGIEKELRAEYDRPFPLDVKPLNEWQKSLQRSWRELKEHRQSNRDGSTLTEKQTVRLLKDMRDKLAARGLPAAWVDQLLKTLPRIRFDRKTLTDRESEAAYFQHGNDIVLDPEVDVDKMTDDQMATLVHEAFHAWHDMVPYWWDLWLSEAEEEAVAGYMESRFKGDSFTNSVVRAIVEADDDDRGGTIQTALDALIEMDQRFGGKLLAGALSDETDRGQWKIVREKIYPKAKTELDEFENRVIGRK